MIAGYFNSRFKFIQNPFYLFLGMWFTFTCGNFRSNCHDNTN